MKNGKSARQYCLENGIKYGRFFVLVDAGFSIEDAIKIEKKNGDLIVKRILDELEVAILKNDKIKIKENRKLLSKLRGRKKC
jgi:hypothetical protein